MAAGDTIAAVATAPGRGGIAVVRVSGPEAFDVAERLSGRPACAPAHPAARVRAIRNPVGDHGLIDEAVVVAFKAPHSYTGEDVVEFQCHGGTVTSRRILEACFAVGARLARRGEFTERAFLNGKIDYDQAESVLELIDAKTSRAADRALEGLSGRKSREGRVLYEAALDISTRIEHSLDVFEDELPDGFVAGLQRDIAALRDRLEQAVRRAREGRILREGALVVLAGPPNAGKSSLMNALLEENRAIVSDVPGTTRDSIEEWMDLDGWPIRLVDTAGLRETVDVVEGEGVRRAEALIDRADIVVSFGGRADSERVIAIHAKCDLGAGEGLNVSARTGEGLERLKRSIVDRLERRMDSMRANDEAAGSAEGLIAAISLLPGDCGDLVLAGNSMRLAAERLGTLVGAVYSEDLLDNLFSRFCVGK